MDPERERAELEAYLGEAYDHSRLQGHEHQLADELAAIGDEQTFYRTSRGYLYDLTVFAMSNTKAPYRRDLARIVAPGARLLDYGCGTGSDGLAFMELGYEVAFADFDNPSVEYLRWRLAHRRLSASIYDLDGDEISTGFDAAYSFDVIEHVDDPFGFLAEMEAHARVVVVNFLDPVPGDTELHHRPLPVRALVRHATRRGLLHYRRYHGRSHLVVYDGGVSGRTVRLRSELELWRGRALSGRS